MGRLDTNSSRGRSPIKTTRPDLQTVAGLESFASAQKFQKPTENKTISTLRAVGGLLNIGTAVVAGATRGALREDTSVLQGISQGFKNRETFGFGNIFREDLGISPTSRGGKIALGTTSFIADVLFDPLTYLTLGTGAGLKVGGKTLTKAGTKLAQTTAREITELGISKATLRGIPKIQASANAVRRATPMVNDLVQRTFGSKGISDEIAREFLDEGVSHGTINTLRQLGPQIIDRGGIKMFGNTLISSKTLANTPVGKAVKILGQTEVASALKNSLGTIFIADFKKNQKLIEIIAKATRQQKQAMEGIALANQNLFRDLSDDQMSTLFDHIFEKKLAVAKPLDDLNIKTTQKAQRLLFDDKKLQQVSDALFEGDNAIVPRFAKLAGLPDDQAIKFYIPSKFSDKMKVKDFAVGRNISSPSLGFLKKFTGVEDNLIRNPYEAYTRGQVEVVTARIKDRAFNSTIKSLGRSVDNMSPEEALRLGYERVSRKGIAGQTIEGYLPKDLAKEVNQFLTPSMKPIDELARATGFDFSTGLFKSYVTSVFPGFHMRNFTSNQFQNMLKIGFDIANPKLQKQAVKIVMGKGLDEVILTKKGASITLKSLRDQIKKESDILDASGAFSNIEQFITEGKNLRRPNLLTKINPLARENMALNAGRKLGSTVESQAKLVNVLSNVMAGKTVKEGIKSAEEALFNYGKITDFERSVMRRMIPFYTFGRKNLEYQLRALVKTPGKIASQLKFFRGLSTSMGEPITQDDLESLPEWVLEGVGIKAGADEYGRNIMYSGFGLPIEEFLGRFSGDKGILWNFTQNILQQSNPIIKYPLERATGLDFFRDPPITELSNAQNLKVFMDAMPEPVAKQFKEALEWNESTKGRYANGKKVGEVTKVTANPFALHLIRNLPTSRITGTVGFLSSEEETNLNKLLRFFTGVKGWTIDSETQKFFNELDRKKELTDWLIRLGAINEFTVLSAKK